MKNWRSNVDPLIKDHLEIQIKEASKHKKAYEQAKNKGNAQLWIALANISKQTFNIELKIKYMERLLQDIVTKINILEAKREKITEETKTEVKPEVKQEIKQEVKQEIKEVKEETKKETKKPSEKKLEKKPLKSVKPIKTIKLHKSVKKIKKASLKKALKRF